MPAERLTAKFDASHREVLTTQDMPTSTLNAPIVGEKAELTLDEAKGLRPQAVAFQLATHLQQHHFPDKPWLFPQLLGIVRDWLGDPDGDSPNVDYGDDTFPGLLLFGEKKHAVCEKITRAIIAASGGAQRLRAELPATDAARHHGGRVVRHRQGLLDDRPGEVPLQPRAAGQRLGDRSSARSSKRWTRCGPTPRTRASASASRTPATAGPGNYYPDLIVKLDDGRGTADLLNLVLEVSGQKKKEKDAKVQTAKTMWVPAVNNLGTFGRWAFLEIDGSNLHKTKQEIRKLLDGTHGLIPSRPTTPGRCHDGRRRSPPPRPSPSRPTSTSPTRRPNIPTRETAAFAADDGIGKAVVPPRPLARPAARLEGQGRAGRASRSKCRPCRSTSRRRSTRRRSSRT